MFNFMDFDLNLRAYGGRGEKWNKSAIDCYLRGCKCEGCDIPHPTEDKCCMKSVVLKLVREIGTPEPILEKEREELQIIEYCKKQLDKGDTITRLAEELKTNETSLGKLLRSVGVYAFDYKKRGI